MSTIYKCINITTYISLLCQLRGSRRNDSPGAMNMPYVQILVSNTILGILGEMADSRTRTGNVQDEARASCNKE